MIKKMNVAGIQLDDFSLRECVMAVERMLSENTFHMIEEVDMDKIILAASDEKVQMILNKLDVSIVVDKAIFDTAGENSLVDRIYDTEDCFYEILKRIERNHKAVFVLSDTEKEKEDTLEYLKRKFPRLSVVGSFALENCKGEGDAIVNEINAATVDVILSVLPSPMQEHFLADNKEKMSAVLWYGVGDNRIGKKKDNIWKRLQRRIRVRILENHINKYES